MWNKSLVDCSETLVGGTTVACKFVTLSNGVEWFFSGVYCRDSESNKETMWKELIECHVKWGNKGIIGGDFNMVLRGEKNPAAISLFPVPMNFKLM